MLALRLGRRVAAADRGADMAGDGTLAPGAWALAVPSSPDEQARLLTCRILSLAVVTFRASMAGWRLLVPRCAVFSVRCRSSYGRLRPSRSCASTHSSATIAEPSEISPHRTVAATISANLRTLPPP